MKARRFPALSLLACLGLTLGSNMAPVGAAPVGRHVADDVHVQGTVPWSITRGPDGNPWFIEEARDGLFKIARITPDGAITAFPVPDASWGGGALTSGADGNLWFAETGKIGRLTPRGRLTEFPLPVAEPASNGQPAVALTHAALTAGLEGSIWFTARNHVGILTPDGRVRFVSLRGCSSGIATGPDGTIWCNESWYPGKAGMIARITPAGKVREFPLPSAERCVVGIAAGPDGSLWFTATGPSGGAIGKISPSGTITEYPLGGLLFPQAIAAGPDGNLWFTDMSRFGYRTGIGRITPAGVISTFTIPTPASNPLSIAAGADGNMWFTEGMDSPNEYTQEGAHAVGRITPTGAITEFPLPAPQEEPVPVATDRDGSLWFWEPNQHKIGVVAPGGAFTDYAIPTQYASTSAVGAASGGVAGASGNVWFTEAGGRAIGRITRAGAVAEFPLGSDNQPSGIGSGPDGSLWAMTGGGLIERFNADGTPITTLA